MKNQKEDLRLTIEVIVFTTLWITAAVGLYFLLK